ncbi:MAG TPA: histidine kinase [Micrococcaceae bacterium]
MQRANLRGFSRWNPANPGWARIALLAVCLGLVAVAAPLNVAMYKIPLVLGLLLAALHSGAVLLAAVRPALGLLMSLIVIALVPLLAIHGPGLPMPYTVAGMLTQLLVLVAAALRTVWVVSTLGWLATLGMAAFISGRWGTRPVPVEETNNMVVFASISFGLLIAAIVARQWQAIRAQLRAQRAVSAEESALRQLGEERARIARELHDVVAHGMSLVAVQATTARYRYPQIDSAVAAEFDDIAANSRRAMTEMRTLLGALRNGETDAQMAPQPTLADVGELIESARRAGIRVDVPGQLPPEEAGLSPVLGLAAYRITQEALSNIIRHAPGSRARVAITRDPVAVHLVVTNTPSISAAEIGRDEAGTAGHGLLGMRERAQIVGGTLEAGPSPEGGFRVEAILPLSGHPVTQDQ